MPPYTNQKHVSQETHNCVCKEGGRGMVGWLGEGREGWHVELEMDKGCGRGVRVDGGGGALRG